jgi:AcrR family transcriptional regulator
MAKQLTVKKTKSPAKAARIREQPEVRRKLLIDATTRSIAKYGYSGTTIERICAEGGVSRGLINHHFGSKEELILQAYKALCDDWTAHTLDGMNDSHDPAEALRSCIEKNFDPKNFNTNTLRIWLGFWSAIPKSPKLTKLDRALYKVDLTIYQGVFERLAQKRKIQLNAQRQAVGLMAMIAGLWLQAALDPKSFSVSEGKTTCLESVEHLLN